MNWLILFLFFLSPSVILAAPQISISNIVPSPIIYVDSFTVQFTVTNNGVGDSYHYKVVGVGVTLDNLPNSACDHDYHSCATLSIGDSQSVNASVDAKITEGFGSVKVRIARADNHNTYDSQEFTVTLISPSPTPSPTATNTPTLTPNPTASSTPSPTQSPAPTSSPTLTATPTSTKTPTPTRTPTPGPSNTLIPTATRTPTPTGKSSPIPTLAPFPTLDPVVIPTDPPFKPDNSPTSVPDILGLSDLILSTPTPKPPQFSFSLNQHLPVIFMILGGGMLLVPVILSRLSS